MASSDIQDHEHGLHFVEPLLTGENHNEDVWKEVKPLIEDYYSALAEGDTEKASKDIDTEKGVFTFNGHKFNGPALLHFIELATANGKYKNTIELVEAVAGETEISVKVKGMASKNSETPRPHEATLYISKGKIIRLDGEAKQVSTPESDSGLD